MAVKTLVCGLFLLGATASAQQGPSPEELLMQRVREALDALAARSGRALYGDVDTGYALSNIPIVLGVSLASLGFVASAPASAFPSSRMLFAKVVVGGSGAMQLVHAAESCSRDYFTCAAWMAPNKHFRIKVHYALSKFEQGSCLLFFALGTRRDGRRTLDFEVDACSDEDVFVETVSGVMRIGGGPDVLDEWMGQTLVVAYRSVEID